MSDTPETDVGAQRDNYREMWESRGEEIYQLQAERDRALKLLAEMKQAIIWAKAEAKERLHRLDQAACERRTWLEAEHKMKLERDEARKALTLIADDCEAWLAGESDEPSIEFIKLVAKYAREASK